MKFLKTFLFTISLTFLSFGVLTLPGFCEAAPQLVPDSNGLSVIQGGGMPYYYSMNGFNEMWFMTPEFNQSINDYGAAFDNYMEQNYGYDLDHFYNYGTNGSVFVDGGSLDAATASWLANKMTQGTLSALQLANEGYSVFSHKAQQWGQNAREWFIGKFDSATGKITDVQNNIVTKITSEGIANYLSMYSNFTQNGMIDDLQYNKPIYSKNFHLTYQHYSSNVRTININTSFNVCYFTQPLNNNITYDLMVIVPASEIYMTGSYPSFSCSGVYVNGSETSAVTYAILDIANQFTLNGVHYYYGKPIFNNNWSNYYNGRIPFGNLVEAQSLLGGNGQTININISPNFDLSSYLDRLIGKYVDNNILEQIIDKINSAPIVIQTIDNQSLPVIEIDPALKDEIVGLIDIAVANSEKYSELLDPLEEPDPDPEPDPEPLPSNQGTEVPEDFPTIIFSPINDSVGGVFDFVSIFEPLFYIFSFSTGLLGLWLVIPFVILFMFLFKLLK